MAHFVDELHAHPSLMSRLGAMFETVMQSSARVRELDRLSAMSDEQLAARGLRREEIVQKIFGDSMSGI